MQVRLVTCFKWLLTCLQRLTTTDLEHRILKGELYLPPLDATNWKAARLHTVDGEELIIGESRNGNQVKFINNDFKGFFLPQSF